MAILSRKNVPGAIVWIPLAFYVLGAVLMLISSYSIENGVLFRRARGRDAATVRGRVLSPPIDNGTNTSFFMEVESARVGTESWHMRERLYVSAEGRINKDLFFQGVSVESSGRLSMPMENARWLNDHGTGCVMRTVPGSIKRLALGPDPISSAVAGARKSLSRAYRRLFDPRIAGFVEGVTISKLDATDEQIIADLRACGLSHIVAVSGLHVGSAAMLALALMGVFGAGRRSRYFGAGAMALTVLSLANFRVSAIRATVMATACFGGAVAGRRYNSLIAISIVGVLILGMNPRAVFDPSFQYSFAAALGIVVIASSTKKDAPAGKVRTSLAVCAGAQLGALPLIIGRGDAVPVSAVVANMLVVWLVGVLIVAALGAALLSCVSLPIARVAAFVPAGLSKYMLSVASWCARLPGAGLFMGVLSALSLLLYVASLVMLARSHGDGSLFKPVMALGTSFLLVLCNCFPIVTTGAKSSMIVMDVGEGDAAVLRDAASSIVLIDGGPEPELLVRKLMSRGIARVDLMVVTHPHADHVTGLIEVMRRMPVGRMLVPGVSGAVPGRYRELLDEARIRHVPFTEGLGGQKISAGPGIELEVLYSPASLTRTPDNLNNCSLVLMAYLEGSRILLMGDLENEAQKDLIGSHPSIACDVLKVPHHGSANATNQEFLIRARPTLASISAGRGNRLGHPSEECLTALGGLGVRVARTDTMGDIEILFRNGRIGLESRR